MANPRLARPGREREGSRWLEVACNRSVVGWISVDNRHIAQAEKDQRP